MEGLIGGGVAALVEFGEPHATRTNMPINNGTEIFANLVFIFLSLNINKIILINKVQYIAHKYYTNKKGRTYKDSPFFVV
jgi:hypothetical protein